MTDDRGSYYRFANEPYIIRDPTTMIHSVVKSGSKDVDIERNTLRILAPDLEHRKHSSEHARQISKISCSRRCVLSSKDTVVCSRVLEAGKFIQEISKISTR